MKKILLLLCILSITISANAQLFGKHYAEGFYYDSVGVKHNGLISWSPPARSIFKGKGDNIYYKSDKKAEALKLSNSLIKSFGMKNDSAMIDSFVITKDKEFEKAPFLHVMLNSDVKIYRSMTTTYRSAGMMPGAGGVMVSAGGYPVSDVKYYYGADPDHLTRLEKKNFIDVMSPLLASKPYVVKRVKDKTFKIGDLEGLLYFYRTDNYPDYKLNH